MTSVKNWDRFQHFKDRSPPWIKLYRDLLDDIQWHKLDPVAAKALVMIWLIASENSGNLPDIEELAFRLRMPEEQVKSVLSKLGHWLDQPDITVISERYHGDTAGDDKAISLTRSRETEAERETETEEETEISAEPQSASPPVVMIPLAGGGEHPVMQGEVNEWAVTYPAVDVVQQLRQMRQWCLAKPERCKTRRGVKAFIVGWLGRQQDKGPPVPQQLRRTSATEQRADFIADLTGRSRSQQGEVIDVIATERHSVQAIAGRVG